MLAGVEPVATYFTAFAWTGYVLLADALVFRLKGRSLIVSRPLEFADTTSIIPMRPVA